MQILMWEEGAFTLPLVTLLPHDCAEGCFSTHRPHSSDFPFLPTDACLPHQAGKRAVPAVPLNCLLLESRCREKGLLALTVQDQSESTMQLRLNER